MTFINRERIALLETKFHFQIEYCNVPTVALFQMRKLYWLAYYWHQANVRVQVADCWRLVVPDVICVRSTKYQSQVLFHMMKQSAVIKLWRIFLKNKCAVNAQEMFLKVEKNSLSCQTNWNQHPPTVSYFACELLAYASSNAINIRYFKWVYHWKISIFNLKMEFWFQCCNPFLINENHS